MSNIQPDNQSKNVKIQILVDHMPAPEATLVDQPIQIIISGLEPGQYINLEAKTVHENNEWYSWTSFIADEKGIVDLTTQPPCSGTYSEIDSMGLFWSMVPRNNEPGNFLSPGNVIEIDLTVTSDNKTFAHKKIERQIISPNVVQKPVREDGIIGTLYFPKNAQDKPAVIVIPGSGGGIPETTAKLLASHGYVVLALGYFGLEGLPDKLKNISLEYFYTSILWLKQQPQVNKSPVSIFGVSRGAELALLLASTYPNDVDGVIAYVPSSSVYSGMSKNMKPAWTYEGKPIAPYNKEGFSDSENQDLMNRGKIPNHPGTFEDPYQFTDFFLYWMKQEADTFEKAAIPVEKIKCPIILFSGEDDKIWPSTLYCNLIMKRLNRFLSTIKRSHFSYRNAGHMVNSSYLLPNLPSTDLPFFSSITKMWYRNGGTPSGNAKALRCSWKSTLEFLESIQQNKM